MKPVYVFSTKFCQHVSTNRLLIYEDLLISNMLVIHSFDILERNI